jgi:alkylated DNA repair protein (DNA oxidative demethylase)
MFQGHVLLLQNYLPAELRTTALKEILSFKPIWEYRFSTRSHPPSEKTNRMLLRPVYWLGNWQFACLNYYHPPKGTEDRCVWGEPYPPVLRSIVDDIERRVRRNWDSRDLPADWHLNTCLINYYGSRMLKRQDGELQKIDAARVGEHKDFEPGPVASLSFGETAVFQFVKSHGPQSISEVVLQQKLADNTLQIFGGQRYKEQLFHRVQRVTKSKGPEMPVIRLHDFETRRINLTFRYVPRKHIQDLNQLPKDRVQDVEDYVRELAQTSPHWMSQMERAREKLSSRD